MIGAEEHHGILEHNGILEHDGTLENGGGGLVYTWVEVKLPILAAKGLQVN